MERKIYRTDGTVSLAQYLPAEDDADVHACWRDEGTERGYNSRCTLSLDEYRARPVRCRWRAVILRCADGAAVGTIFVSPETSPPDLAIMLYPPYRGQGYGTAAFALGVRYCFEALGLDHVYAGCYEGNHASRRMLEKCGFVPHPEGNQNEIHYRTGAPIVQYDFVKYRE